MDVVKRSLLKGCVLYVVLTYSLHLVFEYANKQTLSKAFLIEEAADSVLVGTIFYAFLFLLNKLNKTSK